MHCLGEIPRFYLPACKHWFHHECLLTWLTSDTNLQVKCKRCSKVHYATRWTGRTLCCLQDRFPGSQLPNIGAALTRTEIEKQLVQVKNRQLQPIIPEADFVVEPESFVDGEDEKAEAEFKAKMEEIERHRDKLRVRLCEVIKHRRERAQLKEKLEHLQP